jgi:hypothetical protein
MINYFLDDRKSMCTADNKIDLQENTSKHYGGTVSMKNTEQKKEIQLKVLCFAISTEVTRS